MAGRSPQTQADVPARTGFSAGMAEPGGAVVHTVGDYHRDCTWTLMAVPDSVSGLHTDIAPGTYNSTDSIGVSGTSAQFEAKASITDITNPRAPVTLGGNYVLQMRMNDLSTADATDQISFALWDVRKTGSGKNATTTQLLLFSSNWDGNQTVLQRLAGGNLFVHR